MDQYDLGSMGYVSIEQSNGVKIVKGYYSYSHGKRGWGAEARNRERRSALVFALLGQNRLPRAWPRCRQANGKGPPQRLLAIHGQLHRLHHIPHRRG